MVHSIEGKTAGAIADSARDLIANGHLGDGDLLPPIRVLAARLGVNRNTVASAYRMLVAVGAAQTRGRGGTVVATLPDLSGERSAAQGLVDLAGGNPDPALLPDLRAAIAAAPYTPPLYGAAAIVDGIHDAAPVLFGELAERGELVVTHGAVDAIERVLTAYLVRGDTVVIENPCFVANMGTVRLNGYRTAAAEVDEHGMVPESLADAVAQGARAVIITPRAHNPTGVGIDEHRAAQLRAVLAAHPEVLIIEDDHFSMISTQPYHRVTPETGNRWVLIRSLAKFLGPDLRVALVLADDTTAASMRARLRPGKTWVSQLLQSAAGHLLTDPGTTALIERAAATYQQRAGHLVTALAGHRIPVLGHPDGLNVWVDVPAHCDPETVHADLSRAGWAIQPAQVFTPDAATTRPGIRITTSTMDVPTATSFAGALADAIDRQRIQQ